MVQCINEGESIECNETAIKARQINPAKAVRINQVLYFKLKAAYNSTSVINKELDPKIFVINANSHLDLGDYLDARIIEIYYLGKQPKIKVTPGTSPHRIQSTIIYNFAYSVIFIPMPIAPSRRLNP